MSTKRKPDQRASPIPVRLPLDAKLWLEMHARENCRSQNSLVIEAVRTLRKLREREVEHA